MNIVGNSNLEPNNELSCVYFLQTFGPSFGQNYMKQSMVGIKINLHLGRL
jgi:hypothetical protein